jgi:hypothetical protein
MIRLLRMSVLGILVLSSCQISPTESPPRSPAAREFPLTLRAGQLAVAVTIRDSAGLIQTVGPDPDLFRPTFAQLKELEGAGVIVADAPGGDLVVAWVTGFCNPTQQLSISGSNADVRMVVDHGTPNASVCDLAQTSLVVRIHPAFPIGADLIHASVTGR